ncbi:MAG: hypothetical protein GWO03_01765, partial [Gammaproteobacteria bacterium]|nr:hypothetical protein [Gammaproteobacteria bacterium]
MQATLPVPAARAGRRRSPALPVLAVLVLALPALLAAGCKSSSLTDMSDKPTDPGIAAALRVTEQRMQRMFDELLANPVVPFAEFDGIHYRPILAQVQ